MLKNSLWGSQMSLTESAFVSRARGWIAELCREEMRGAGDLGEAMRRLALRLRLPFGFLFEMTYRPPKRISVGRFFTLWAAHEEYLQRQKYREERASFEPSSPLGRLMVRAADLVSGESAGGVK